MAKTNKELAFMFFDTMEPGQVIAVKEIAKKDPDAFKGFLRDYIDEGGLITIDSDWRKFRKDNNPEDFVYKDKQDWFLEFIK